MKFEDLGPDDLEVLATAAIVGVAHLARELKRLGASSEEDSLEDAKRLRPIMMAQVEALRNGENPEAAGLRSVGARATRELGWPGRMPTVEEIAGALAGACGGEPVAWMEHAGDLHRDLQELREGHLDDGS